MVLIMKQDVLKDNTKQKVERIIAYGSEI